MPTTIDDAECYNTGESVAYLDVSHVTFKRKVALYNKEHPDDEIKAYSNNLRRKAKYYRQSDLEKLRGFVAKVK